MAYEVRDNEEQGLSRLPTQFDDSPLVRDYLRTYLQGVDGLSELANDYLEGIKINTAVGVQLDIIGQLVGEPRLVRSDQDYRIAIKTKIILNTSRGTPRDVYAAAEALSGSTSARLWEHFPSSVVVAVDGANLSEIPQDIARRIDLACSAGVNCEAVLVDTDSEGLIFSEIVFEEGTIVTDTGDDLIDDTGDFIEYQVSTDTTINTATSPFAEIPSDFLVNDPSGDQYFLNQDNWIIFSVDQRPVGSGRFYELFSRGT